MLGDKGKGEAEVLFDSGASESVMRKSLAREMIVGTATMQEWDIRLNPKEEKITVGVDPTAIELYGLNSDI